MKNFQPFFNPKSVALIGATDRPGSVGLGICKNLLEGKSQRKIFFVNPYKKKVLGRKTYPKITSISQNIDLVIVAVPAPVVSKVVQDCVKKKVGGVIIISSGFAEIGKEGERRQKEIVEILKTAGVPLLGPNCLGVIRPSSKLNASFAPATPKPGSIAFLSQSGALIDSVIDKSLAENFGFSALISYGNEADLDICDFLKFLTKDKKTKAISLYIEAIKNGGEFLKIASQVSKEKPIVVLKGGKSTQGKKAVASHTASLAGNPEIYSAAFKKAGIFEVETVEDLFAITLTLAQVPPSKNGIGILTNGGAAGVLTADWCQKFGIELPNLSPSTLKTLEKSQVMNPAFSRQNPLDIVGDALSERYKVAAQVLLSQKNIYGLIFIQTLQIMTEVKKNAKVIVEAKKKYPQKPILALLLGGKFTKVGVEILRKNSIPCFTEPRQAALAMKALIWRKNLLK
jgi:acetyltransferase